MAKIKVFIDAGHNPQNPNAGAEGNGLREQDITYEVARIAADLFNANPDYEARLSRETPDVVLGTTNATSLRARVEAANEWGADYFISVHTNASSFANASNSVLNLKDKWLFGSSRFFCGKTSISYLSKRFFAS